jgi:hypothetical protein
MPLLAKFFGSILTALAGFWFNYVSQRVALGLALATLFAGMTAAMVVGLTASGNALIGSMPGWMGRAVCWVWPDNGNLCISTVMAATAARWAYDVNLKYLQWLNLSTR